MPHDMCFGSQFGMLCEGLNTALLLRALREAFADQVQSESTVSLLETSSGESCKPGQPECQHVT